MTEIKEFYQKKIKPLLRQMLSLIILAGIAFYVLYQVTGAYSGEVTVTAARYFSVEDVYSFNAYIFRNESVLLSSNKGVADYLVEDGSHVSAGTELIRVYENGAGEKHEFYARMAELKYQISLLEKSILSSSLISNMAEAEKQASLNYSGIMTGIYNSEYGDVIADIDNFLISINRLKIFSGENRNFAEKINELNGEADKLRAAYSGAFDLVKAKDTGYFFKDADGFEDDFLYDMIKEAPLEDFLSLFFGISQNDGYLSEYAAGKMVYDYIWYIAMPVEKSLSGLFKEGNSYDVVLSYNEDLKLEMTHFRTVSSGTEDTAVVILSCSRMPKGFDYRRMQGARIVLGRTSGYRVPTDALHVEKGEWGVYILTRSTVRFRKTIILSQRDGYVIVKDVGATDENYAQYLKHNDSIITSGKNLYDGKIVD